MSGKRSPVRGGVTIDIRRPTSGSTRTFRLTVQSGKGEAFGVAIAEAYGAGTGPTIQVVTLTPAQTGRVLDAVISAMKASGHSPGRLSVARSKPISLDEPAGVRLAISLMATQPITNHERIREVVAGVAFMSVEETYYWYAKCVGPDRARARKALRILLADDKPRKLP